MIITVEGNRVKLPDFLIVGAVKCGTTFLYHCLRQHPQLFMPTHKEPRYFCFNGRHPQYIGGTEFKGDKVKWQFEDYVKLFEDAKEEQIIGEASPPYFYKFDTTIPHIKSIYGEGYKDLKIIIILRNPVDRAISHFYFQVRRGVETLTFDEAMDKQTIEKRIPRNMGFDYIGHGMYYKMAKAYLEEFSNVKLLLFEELMDTDKLLNDLFEFLNVSNDVKIKTDMQVNPSGIPKSRILVNLIYKISRGFKRKIPDKYVLKLISLRDNVMGKVLYKPKMNHLTREKLVSVFREDIINLQKLTNRNLSNWLK